MHGIAPSLCLGVLQLSWPPLLTPQLMPDAERKGAGCPILPSDPQNGQLQICGMLVWPGQLPLQACPVQVQSSTTPTWLAR